MSKQKNNNIKKLIKSWWRTSKKLFRQIRVLIALPINIGEAIFMSGYCLRIGMPLDKTLMKSNKEIMKDDGWKIFYERTNPNGWYPSISFKKEINKKTTLRVEFVYFEHNEGSTCVRKEIGKETVVQPIFEIVCKDGAKENAI